MLGRLYGLLTRSERLALLRLLPWVVGAALFEVVGVAAVIPFLSLLADPESIGEIPFIGGWLAGFDAEPLVLLRWMGLGVAVAVALLNLMMILTNWRLVRFSWYLHHDISTRLLRHYLSQRYDFLLHRNSADLANKVTQEVLRITQDGFGSGVELIAKSAVALTIVVFLVILDPALALYALLSLVGAFGLIYLVSRGYLRRIGREATRLNATRLRIINEAFGGFKELKVSGREAAVMDRYLSPSERYAEIRAVSNAVTLLPRFGLEAIAVGGMVLIASLMAGSSLSFSSTLPLLGAYAFAGLRLMPALQSIFASLSRFRFALGAIEAVEEDFAKATELQADLGPVETSRMSFTESIDLRDVGYRYPTATRPALIDVSLSIPKRGNIALVGRTGSGKTTLADVILGLLPLDDGYIEVDGVRIGPDNLVSYRRLFGYVPQSIFLTDGSIRRNVAFGVADDAIDDDMVRRACEAAQISGFIETELPDAYDTVVGERGIRLSGGQRQRIGIARALYYDPPVLIFDEATSALDVHTEKAVYDALGAIAATRTVITIAHRLEALADSDHVVVLEGGRVVDSGAANSVLTRYRQPSSSAAV